MSKPEEIDLDALSDDDEWVDSMEHELTDKRYHPNRFIKRHAKKPKRTPDYLLGYNTTPGSLTMSAAILLKYLESDILYKDVGKLIKVCTTILQQETNEHRFVWTYFKPYHLECLVYQVASAIQVGTITKDNVHHMRKVFECYKMVITSSKGRAVAVPETRENKKVGTYIQWVANAGEGMVNNLAIVYYFLKEECKVPGLPAFGKLI